MNSVPLRIPILTYHSLDTSGSVISVAPSLFRQHMESLAQRGRKGVALADLIAAWEGGPPLPDRAVVLTFDDGFLNVAEHGLPILTRLGFRATIFAVSGYCGKHNDWSSESVPIPRMPLLSFAQLRELAAAGFEVGSHGHRHVRLDRVSSTEAEAEIADSRRALEDGLGRAVLTFAYPYGSAVPATRPIVRSHYRAACSTELATARVSEDRHFLSRVDSYYFRAPALFATLDTPSGRVYLSARRLGRTLRQRFVASHGDVT